jgi:hypothetical protein
MGSMEVADLSRAVRRGVQRKMVVICSGQKSRLTDIRPWITERVLNAAPMKTVREKRNIYNSKYYLLESY